MGGIGDDEVEFAEVAWRHRPLRLEYRWLGDAASPRPAVVFLHEGLGSIAMWKDFPARFCAEHGLRGLVFSRYGYGRSTPKPVDERWPPAFMHQQAHEVLPLLFDRLGLARPWLFGHSDGASIALLYAARFDPSGVIAVAPHLMVEELSIASIEKSRDAYERTDLRQRLSRYHDDPDSAFRGWNDAWLDPAFRTWRIDAEIATVRCPVLAVQGEDDEYGTLAQIRSVQAQVPGTRLCVLAACGHSPHRDQPTLLSAEAGRFILDHSRG